MSVIHKILSKESSKNFYIKLGCFDDYSQGRNVLLGSVKVAAVTTVQRLSLPRDAAKLACPWGKLAVYNNARGQSATVKSLKVNLRKVG